MRRRKGRTHRVREEGRGGEEEAGGELSGSQDAGISGRVSGGTERLRMPQQAS